MYQIVRGGQARRYAGRKQALDKAHTAVIETQGDKTVKDMAGAIAWWTDLRRGQLEAAAPARARTALLTPLI